MRRLMVGILTGILFAAWPAIGQIKINKGFKAGLNVSDLRGENDEDIVTRNGINAGVFVELDLLGPINIQAEAIYSQKGANSGEGDNELSTCISYIEIPLLARFGIPLAPPLVSSSFFAGPALGFKTGETTEYNGETLEGSTDSFKSSDIGAVVGASMSFSALGAAAVFIDLRYTLGLSNVLDNPDGDESVKNSAISLSLGLSM